MIQQNLLEACPSFSDWVIEVTEAEHRDLWARAYHTDMAMAGTTLALELR